MEESKREVMAELDNEWHTLRYGNPVPGLYPQTGAEVVKVRGSSTEVGDQVITTYEIVVMDEGRVVGTYKVVAEEELPDFVKGYEQGEAEGPDGESADSAAGSSDAGSGNWGKE